MWTNSCQFKPSAASLQFSLDKYYLYIIWQLHRQPMLVGWMGEELWNNGRQLHANWGPVSLCSLCVIMCKLPTKQTRQEESRVLELSFWSSLSVLWLNELWWEGWGGGGGFELFLLLKRQIWTVVGTLEARQHPPHIISGYCRAVSGGSVYREGTGTRFSSIMHDNKSQRPTVYCGEPLRLWPKWFGHEENFPVHAGPNLKNTAW